MADQVKGPFGALLVRLSLADSKIPVVEEAPEASPKQLIDQAADYLEQLIRFQARAAGGVANLTNVPQA